MWGCANGGVGGATGDGRVMEAGSKSKLYLKYIFHTYIRIY